MRNASPKAAQPCRKLADEDLQAIESIIVKHTEVRAEAFRAHWKRRTCCIIGVMVLSYTTHIVLENKSVEAFAQSFEAAISALIEYAFNKSREL